MPQMAPLLWVKLYLFFILVFLLVIISNFFIKLPNKMTSPYSPSLPSSYQWKW